MYRRTRQSGDAAAVRTLSRRQAYAERRPGELEGYVRITGFYRQKAKTIRDVCRELVDRFGGEVPRTMEEMVTLPGVARKTANVVFNNAFAIPSGVIVDTHVARVSQRLGLSERPKPERIEQDLMRIIPQDEWIHFGPALVLHGRYTCTAHQPKCCKCIFNDLCPERGVETPAIHDRARRNDRSPEANSRKIGAAFSPTS